MIARAGSCFSYCEGYRARGKRPCGMWAKAKEESCGREGENKM